MIVRLWGVRGSLPTPMNREEYHEKLIHAMEYARLIWQTAPDTTIEEIITGMHPNHKSVIGGDTTCVEVEHQGSILVMDLGTGARRLGMDLMRRNFRGDLHICLTHTHWDHIQGFPFFIPAYIPENKIHFFSCIANLKERFDRQQHFEHFPRPFDDMPAGIDFTCLEHGGSFKVGPFEIETKPLIHPGNSVAYKIKVGEKVFIFATDTEFYGPDLSEQMDDYLKFFQDADLLVMDAQYSLEEAEQKKGWGHTAMTVAVDCSLHWKVKKLVLTHHEPAHTDQAIWKLFDEACEYLNEFNPDGRELEIFMAKEGDTYDLT